MIRKLSVCNVSKALIRALWMLPMLCLLMLAPQNARAATDYHLSPGKYDVSTYSGATNLYLNQSGTYTLTGRSESVLVYVADNGGNITLKLDNLYLNPDNSAPGSIIGTDRSAITVADVEGATVRIVVESGKRADVGGWNQGPAICKTGTKTALIFEGGGKLNASADPEGFRTAAIGSAETENINGNIREKYSFGNVTFNNIHVRAIGSGYRDTPFSVLAYWGRGGPGIGASFGGYVNGITFNNGCIIEASAGGADAAAIGTASGSWTFNPIMMALEISTIDTPCKNVTINGGEIYARYISTGKYSHSGAGIGGGEYCSAENLTINGGKVVDGIEGHPQNCMWSTGIGAGTDESVKRILITGGNIYAVGKHTGIGGGQSEGGYTDEGAS